MVSPPRSIKGSVDPDLALVVLAWVPVIIPVSSVLVPVMIMLELAAVALPIPVVELLPFIARAYPRGAVVGRPSVVSTVPNITIV